VCVFLRDETLTLSLLVNGLERMCALLFFPRILLLLLPVCYLPVLRILFFIRKNWWRLFASAPERYPRTTAFRTLSTRASGAAPMREGGCVARIGRSVGCRAIVPSLSCHRWGKHHEKLSHTKNILSLSLFRCLSLLAAPT
jgi:hypothetical protein